MIYGEILVVIPSSSSYKERSKFPEGLKATETATSRERRFNCCDMEKETRESEVGLKEIHGDGEGIECFKEGEIGSNGLKVAMGVVSLVSL